MLRPAHLLVVSWLCGACAAPPAPDDAQAPPAPTAVTAADLAALPPLARLTLDLRPRAAAFRLDASAGVPALWRIDLITPRGETRALDHWLVEDPAARTAGLGISPTQGFTLGRDQVLLETPPECICDEACFTSRDGIGGCTRRCHDAWCFAATHIDERHGRDVQAREAGPSGHDLRDAPPGPAGDPCGTRDGAPAPGDPPNRGDGAPGDDDTTTTTGGDDDTTTTTGGDDDTTTTGGDDDTTTTGGQGGSSSGGSSGGSGGASSSAGGGGGGWDP